jgi:GTP-binding protein
MKFLDKAKVFMRSGSGGNGCLSFRREKFVELGGPDGGNGGKGGSVYLKAIHNLNTLIDFRYCQHFKAQRGQDGMGKSRSGRKGDDLVIQVPVGTEVWDEESQVLLFDLDQAERSILLLKGGDGGIGNEAFKSSRNRAPRRTVKGFSGEESWFWLKLKLIADVGFVGFPNGGKSTLLSLLSEAKPRVADYPFTTLKPQLGALEDNYKSIVCADLPGLIQGAHMGKGLGHRFLGHIERCKAIFHIIDGSSPNILEKYHKIRSELGLYNPKLLDKKEILCISKIDLLSKTALIELEKHLEQALPEIPKIFYSFTNPQEVKDLFLRQVQFLFA